MQSEVGPSSNLINDGLQMCDLFSYSESFKINGNSSFGVFATTILPVEYELSSGADATLDPLLG